MILCRNPAVLAGYRKCAVSLTITETDVPREIREGISQADGVGPVLGRMQSGSCIRSFHARLVPEVAHAGEDHGYSQAVGGLDGLVVAYGAARLNDGFDPGFSRLFHVVGEGE